MDMDESGKDYLIGLNYYCKYKAMFYFRIIKNF